MVIEARRRQAVRFIIFGPSTWGFEGCTITCVWDASALEGVVQGYDAILHELDVATPPAELTTSCPNRLLCLPDHRPGGG